MNNLFLYRVFWKISYIKNTFNFNLLPYSLANWNHGSLIILPQRLTLLYHILILQSFAIVFSIPHYTFRICFYSRLNIFRYLTPFKESISSIIAEESPVVVRISTLNVKEATPFTGMV